MSDRHVVGLQVVVHRDLPVHVPGFGRDGRKRHHVLEAIGRELIRERAPHPGDRLWIAGQRDEDESERNVHFHRAQPVLGPVESREGIPCRHSQQRTIMAVRPAVVRASDGARAVAVAIEQPRAAMTADVVERPDHALAVAQADDALRTDVQGDVIAGLPELADVAKHLPARQQDPFDLEPRHLRVAVDPGGHRPRGCGHRAAVLAAAGGRARHLASPGQAGNGKLYERLIYALTTKTWQVRESRNSLSDSSGFLKRGDYMII